ncbi:MAG: Lrp/AsnC family transcriptional regulator [Methylophilaceae bacterium]|jgi:DNA-binding Lrp family transcriptional regulator|uniref:Lrp/AsnC family transcriptional regulator n=1 Tax=Methylobacillus sp. MM3 TaxID=1848039 RepID=UPI0007DEF75F|nr:AsnC family transcriptional regulator [Methylobacillus sp. MM3]OAJ71926.1 protein nirG [Methylobacillus sp. MM3]
MDATDRAIINSLQGGFPICERPYQAAAEQLGIGEDELLARLKHLLDDKILTRFGPMYQIERMGGAFSLAAMRVPEADFERVAAIVNAMPEVAHNYQRQHSLNMWFVLATETPDGIASAIAKIEAATGNRVINVPKEREYFVGARFVA